LKVLDFNGDEVGCFDRDLEVLILGALRVSGQSVLGVDEHTTGDRLANGWDAEN
jgi:hypothetical protein